MLNFVAAWQNLDCSGSEIVNFTTLERACLKNAQVLPAQTYCMANMNPFYKKIHLLYLFLQGRI